jgi:hypothetical protein
MKLYFPIGLSILTIACAQINSPSALDKTYVEPYNPLPTITTKIGTINDTPTIPSDITRTINIDIHVINGANGQSINQAEISMDGKYLGNTNIHGDFHANEVSLGAHNFTIYHGQYFISFEKHDLVEGMSEFTSMLTRIY